MTMTGPRSTTAEPYAHDERDDARYRSAMTSMGVGAVLALLGILGFIPGVTQHVAFKAGERFSGPESHAMLFGVFQTSVLSNLILIALGVLGAVSAFFELTSRLFLVVGGLIVGFFAIYGLAVDRASSANFLPLNADASWLRLGIAVVMLLAGVVLSLRRRH